MYLLESNAETKTRLATFSYTITILQSIQILMKKRINLAISQSSNYKMINKLILLLR